MSQIKCCLACGEPLHGQRAREHILPKWLQRHLGISELQVEPSHFDTETGQLIRSRPPQPLDQFVEGRICGPCNSGWMSRLENDAKRLMLPLLNSSRGIRDLTHREQSIVARWAVKTAFVLNSANDTEVRVSGAHMEWIRNRKGLPPNVSVVANQHNHTRAFNWLQGNSWHVYGRQVEPLEEARKLHAYTISFQIADLLLLVGYWPLPGWGLGIWPGVHFPLWPTKVLFQYGSESMQYPNATSDLAFGAFHCSLALVQMEGSQGEKIIAPPNINWRTQ